MNCSGGIRRAWARICDSPSTHIAPAENRASKHGAVVFGRVDWDGRPSRSLFWRPRTDLGGCEEAVKIDHILQEASR
jgi:hypothetical protein